MYSKINWISFSPDILRLLGVISVFALILGCIIYYNFVIRRTNPKEVPKGFAFLIFNLINYFRNLTRDILGQDLEKLSPIFLTLFVYIAASNMIGIIGFENPTSSIGVTVSLGLFSFIGTFVIGFRYQRFSFLYKFTFNIKVKNKKNNKVKKIPIMINPLEVMSSVTPLISLSFRLWGNIFAGALILSLVYNLPLVILTGNVSQLVPGDIDLQSPITIVASIMTPPIHMFLDIGIGIIQAMVFVLLTMVYWTLNKQE